MKIGERYIVKRCKADRLEVWSHSMNNCVGKEGNLISITDGGNAILAFDDGSYSCYIHPLWLEKVEERKPEFNEKILVHDAGQWVERHFCTLLPDGRVLCFLWGDKFPKESRVMDWSKWRLIDQPSDDEWAKYTF